MDRLCERTLVGIQAVASLLYLLSVQHRTVLLVALDESIVSTALPRLSSEFQALGQLTWVVSAFILAQAGLLLFFGQVLSQSRDLAHYRRVTLTNPSLKQLFRRNQCFRSALYSLRWARYYAPCLQASTSSFSPALSRVSR